MPRFSCPGYPDCNVDCPRSGYAYFRPPHGPCLKGCHDTEAAEALVRILRTLPADARISSTVVGMRLSTLVDFARNVSPFVRATAPLIGLQQLVVLEDRTFDVEWHEAGPAGVIEAFANAVGSETAVPA